MPSITIGNEAEGTWMVARWAFCAYLQHVEEEIRGDGDLELTIEKAMALDGLHLALQDGQIVRRLIPVLRCVAAEIVDARRDARVDGRVLDEGSQAQFREAVGELRDILDKYVDAPEGGAERNG